MASKDLISLRRLLHDPSLRISHTLEDRFSLDRTLISISKTLISFRVKNISNHQIDSFDVFMPQYSINVITDNKTNEINTDLDFL